MTNKYEGDIFDRIMSLPGLRIFAEPYRKYKSILLYLFFGGVSLVINIALFIVLVNIICLDALISNVVCWIVCVIFQFYTNRTWAFEGRVDTKSAFLKQMISFFGSRGFTLLVEETILAIFIEGLSCDAAIIKIIAQFVTIVMNYILSKMFVFRKKKE